MKMKKMTLIIVLLIFVMQFSNIRSAKSLFFEDNDFVDGIKDEFYSSVKNGSYNISIGNSDKNIGLYVESFLSFSEIQIDTLLIQNNTDSIYHKALFNINNVEFIENNVSVYRNVYSAEILIVRDYKGVADKNFIIKINSELFQLDFSLLTNPNIEPVKTSEFTMSWYEIATIFIIFFILLTLTYMNMTLPVIHVQNPKEYIWEKLGKYTKQFSFNEKIQKFELYFKNTSTTLKKVYSDYSYEALSQFDMKENSNTTLKAILSFHHVFPHVIKKTIDLPDGIFVENQKLMNTTKNIIKRFFIFVFGFFHFFGYVKSIWDSMDFEVIKENKIEFLQLEYNLESLKYVFDVKYKQNRLNEKTGNVEKRLEENKNVAYSDIQALKDSDAEIIEIVLSNVEIVKFANIKEAINNRKNIEEIHSLYAKKFTDSSIKIRNLNSSLIELMENVRNLKDNFNEELIKKLKESTEKTDSLMSDLPSLVDSITYYKSLGHSKKDVMSFAMKDYLDKREKEKELDAKQKTLNLEKEILELKSQLESKKEVKVDSFE